MSIISVNIRILMAMMFSCLMATIAGRAQIAIIPKPSSISLQKGHFAIPDQLGIYCSDLRFSKEAEIFMTETAGLKSIKTTCSLNKTKSGSHLVLEYVNMREPEAYTLDINNDGIKIKASTSKGIFYGLQSLFQMMGLAGNHPLPHLHIQDQPQFSWRGMHLDVCRHFFSKDEVKKYIDYLAFNKMNIFHWHLTDDQGWRIEIKKYPELCRKGAWRRGSMIGNYSDQTFDSISYGGYYSQEEVKDIVHYAAERHVTIVPEIEMPGHALAALSAYPRLSCTGGPFEVGKAWGVYDDVFCAGNDSVFLFLQDVLTEVTSLFPGPYLHIGGDECPKTRWKSCHQCQKRMKVENLSDEHQLQSWFVQRIEKYLNGKGKKIIGWDEILEGGLAPNAAVMSWRGTEGGIEAAQANHNVVMTPGKPCYFDHYQVTDKDHEPLAIGGLNTLADVYAYNPIPEKLPEAKRKYILGAQGNVWTEYMPDFKQVEYMALPRMMAMAEILWGGKKQKNYKDFLNRLKSIAPLLDQKGTNYCKHFLSE